MRIRDEAEGDIPAIRRLVAEAMLTLAQSTGTEADIVERLRAEGALVLSLVAEDGGEVVGYLAASAGRIGRREGWGLIGPLAVLPSRHGEGVGTALMAEALRRLRAAGGGARLRATGVGARLRAAGGGAQLQATGPGARGAALVGDPAYYGRFGFRAFPGLGVTGCPPEVVLALPFDGAAPRGELVHHPAFGLDQPE